MFCLFFSPLFFGSFGFDGGFAKGLLNFIMGFSGLKYGVGVFLWQCLVLL